MFKCFAYAAFTWRHSSLYAFVTYETVQCGMFYSSEKHKKKIRNSCGDVFICQRDEWREIMHDSLDVRLYGDTHDTRPANVYTDWSCFWPGPRHLRGCRAYRNLHEPLQMHRHERRSRLSSLPKCHFLTFAYLYPHLTMTTSRTRSEYECILISGLRTKLSWQGIDKAW